MSIIIKSGASGNLLTVDGTAGAARTTLYDTSGPAIATVTGGSSIGASPIFLSTAVFQGFFNSTNNSTVSNLGSGATFTGTSDSTSNYQGIEVYFFADQPVTIQVQQAQESPGVNWNLVDSYTVAASTADSRVFQANAESVRVVVTNNGGSTTTALRLQTSLTPIANPLPRALTQFGNLKVAIIENTPFRATYNSVASAITPPATPTDIVTLTGSASKTIRVFRVELSTTQTTAGINTFFLVKRSTANTGGTSAALTAVSHDSTDAAATATALSYTANPTLGTPVGNIRATKILSPAPASVATPPWVWDFSDAGYKPIILRGTSQVLALNFNGAALPTGLSVNCSFGWTEE